MARVSVVVPCYNEQDTITGLLDALRIQTLPASDLEVIIADGGSTDTTRQRIAEYGYAYPELIVRVVDNPQRNIPAGLNQAIKAAQGELIVRLDAHSAPYPDYLERSVAAIEAGAGDNVGGVWEIRPRDQSWQACAIAAAAAHPLGVGDARYRYSDQAGLVDTVPFGAFHRSLIERMGGFDETLLTNEDYEFNVRVRKSGGRVWLDPTIRSIYLARGTLGELARQYWRYGYWKARMLRRYPETIRWRQALPPLFVLSLVMMGTLAIGYPFAAWIFVIECTTYALILMMVGMQLAWKHRDWRLAPGVPLAIAVMHLAWGSAFLWSMIVQWR